MGRLLCFALLILAACGAGPAADGADAGPIEPSEVGQGSEARGELVVNEVSARPTGGEDWLELFNRSDVAIDLCGFFVTDSLDRLDHYYHLGQSPPPLECEPRLLGPGEYLVVTADDDVEYGPDHAPFKLGVADEAHVVSLRGEAIDSLVFLHPRDADGFSLARQPNGEGLFWTSEPSPGASNLTTGEGSTR